MTFRTLTYIPGTRAWRGRRDAVRWLRGSQDAIREVLPAYRNVPIEDSRSQAQLLLAIECVAAALQGVVTGMRGGDAKAVFQEHMPDLDMALRGARQ